MNKDTRWFLHKPSPPWNLRTPLNELVVQAIEPRQTTEADGLTCPSARWQQKAGGHLQCSANRHRLNAFGVDVKHRRLPAVIRVRKPSQSLDVTLALRLVSKNDLHIVGPAVVEQWDRCGIDRRAV